MTEACYFVVERRLGRLSGSLYYDRLPTKYVGKRAREQGLHYAKRVDDQPHLAGLSRQQLFDAWEALGTLPDHKEVQLHGEREASDGGAAGGADRAAIEGAFA